MLKVILNTILPNHVKRLLFCGSVYAHIAVAHQVVPDSKRLQGLNRKLKIANGDNSIQTTCSWSKHVWKELPPPPYTEDKLRQYIAVIVKNVPSYLRYGRTGDMEKDLSKIVKYILQDKDFVAPKIGGESPETSVTTLA